MEKLIKKQLRKNSQANDGKRLKSRQRDSYNKFKGSKSSIGTQKLMSFSTTDYATAQNTHRQKSSVERILEGKDRITPSFGLEDMRSEQLYRTVVDYKGDRLSHGLPLDIHGKPIVIEDQRFNTAEKTCVESLKTSVEKSASRNHKLSTDISDKSVIVFELTPSQLYRTQLCRTQGNRRYKKKRNTSAHSYTAHTTSIRGMSKFIKKTKKSLSRSQASMQNFRPSKLKISNAMKPKKTVRINYYQLAGF
jgi:hypothetical protein